MSLLTVAVFAAVGGYTYVTARFHVTRQVALITLLLAAAELILSGLLTAALPILHVVLWAARLVVLGCCVGACRRDRRAARRREARRASCRLQMRCAAHPLHVVPASMHEATRCA